MNRVTEAVNAALDGHAVNIAMIIRALSYEERIVRIAAFVTEIRVHMLALDAHEKSEEQGILVMIDEGCPHTQGY